MLCEDLHDEGIPLSRCMGKYIYKDYTRHPSKQLLSSVPNTLAYSIQPEDEYLVLVNEEVSKELIDYEIGLWLSSEKRDITTLKEKLALVLKRANSKRDLAIFAVDLQTGGSTTITAVVV